MERIITGPRGAVLQGHAVAAVLGSWRLAWSFEARVWQLSAPVVGASAFRLAQGPLAVVLVFGEDVLRWDGAVVARTGAMIESALARRPVIEPGGGWRQFRMVS